MDGLQTLNLILNNTKNCENTHNNHQKIHIENRKTQKKQKTAENPRKMTIYIHNYIRDDNTHQCQLQEGQAVLSGRTYTFGRVAEGAGDVKDALHLLDNHKS